MYQIAKRVEADCDGGRTFWVVIDMSENDAEMTEWYEDKTDAEAEFDRLCDANPDKDPR